MSEVDGGGGAGGRGGGRGDLDAQVAYMDTVCRSFAKRLEQRRNVIITSVRFHRLADEVSASVQVS